MTIDLNIDTSANPERHLLAAVVALAVKDACMAPPRFHKTDKRDRQPGLLMTTEAFTAMRFLFDETQSGVDEYAVWLEFDAGQLRRKLLDLMHDDSPRILADFDPMKRRNFRINYKIWQAVRHNDNAVETETEEGEE